MTVTKLVLRKRSKIQTLESIQILNTERSQPQGNKVSKLRLIYTSKYSVLK